MRVQRPLIALAGAALVAIAGTSACTEQETKLPQPTARVTLNGNSRTTHAISCMQVQWTLTVAITAGPGRVRAVVELEGEKPTPTSVDIADFDGFTGTSGQGVGNVDIAFADNTYTITGTAQGSNPDDPSKPKTATYRIEAEC
jgi:ipoprotein LpqH